MKIKIPIKAISVNAAESSTRSGRRFKSKKYKIWYSEVIPYVKKHTEILKKFALDFDETKQIKAIYNFPISGLYVKGGKRKGLINLRAGDTDNMIKNIQDLLFVEMGLYNEKIEDAYIFEFSAKKHASLKSGMEIEYQLI